MVVKEIWRYPVKSMAGQSIDRCSITELGLNGDRILHVRDARGRVVTSRTHPALLGHRGTSGIQGEPLIDGRPWTAPEVLAEVRTIAGPGATLVRDESESRFDVLPLLVATDGAIAAFGRDGRRLRPNLIIAGVEGLAERTWPGGRLRIGSVTIFIHSLRSRCVMTTYDPDTQEQDPEVLRDIARRFEGKLALNCIAEKGGVVHVGQAVEVELPEIPPFEAP